MDALILEPQLRDADGWVAVRLVTQPMDESHGGEFTVNDRGDASEGEVVGYVREVEGTEKGPIRWFDARVVDDTLYERRFTSFEAAVLAMALRRYFPPDTNKLVGW